VACHAALNKREPPDIAPAARKSVPPRQGYRRREPDLLLRSSWWRSGCTGQPVFDHREHFVERHPTAAVDFLIEKLRLLIVDGGCRQRDVVGAVGKLRDFGEEVFDGLSDGRGGHLPSPSAVAGLPHGLSRSLVLGVLVVAGDFADDDFGIERDRLENNAEALVVLERPSHEPGKKESKTDFDGRGWAIKQSVARAELLIASGA
jgi:hypothetical protein